MLMWYDDAIKEFADINYEINKRYCLKNNYNLIKSSNKQLDKHPSWEKLPLILQYINNYDYIVMCDSDAFFYYDSPKIENVINKHKNKDIILSGDILKYVINFNKNINIPDINCGLMIIKNTDFSKKFIHNWCYEKHISMDSLLWEQGVMYTLYNNNYMNIQNKSIIIPFNILQNFYKREDKFFYSKQYGLTNKPFVYHLAGQSKEIRIKKSSDYYNYLKNNDFFYVISIQDKLTYSDIVKKYQINDNYFPIIFNLNNLNELQKIEIYYNYIKVLDDSIDKIMILNDINLINDRVIHNQYFNKVFYLTQNDFNIIGNKKQILQELKYVYDILKYQYSYCLKLTYNNPKYNNLLNNGIKYDNYSFVYNSIFQTHKDKILNIGVLTKENYDKLLTNFFINSNIHNINDEENIIEQTKVIDKQKIIEQEKRIDEFNYNKDINYDILIYDKEHNFNKQISFIKKLIEYVKECGMIIIQNIDLNENQDKYIYNLTDNLSKFRDYYFLEINNHKMFILVKKGDNLIFTPSKKITIITPSYRTTNIHKLYKSIDFDYIDEWIIVYDGNKITKNPNLFENNKNIKEYLYKGNGISGNPQRNFALNMIKNKDTYIYYLDDDNIIHPDLYRLLNIIHDEMFYTFNQYYKLKGNNPTVYNIDTAMFLIHYNLCKDIKWIPDKYEADGYYIQECYNKNKDKHIFVNNDLCYYNKINE